MFEPNTMVIRLMFWCFLSRIGVNGPYRCYNSGTVQKLIVALLSFSILNMKAVGDGVL